LIEQRTIPASEATRLLRLHESHFIDLKRIEILPAKLSESVSAFANTVGGELFIGIGENPDKTRFWRGFDSMEDANGLFQVIGQMTALGSHYSATFFSSNALPGFVLHLLIPKTRDIVTATNGNIFVRHNAQNIKVVGPEALQRLKLDKGIVSFEDETVNVPLSRITNSTTTIQFMLDVVPSSEPDQWLDKQNLIVGEKPIVAGVMLYDDEPQSALPKRSAIKIYRYQTKDENGTRELLAFDPITIEGCIYQQIIDGVNKTKEIIEELKALDDSGLTTISYPDETLHEILTNAILHRDYSLPSDVHIRIFENRIEVESPGRLPGHVTVKNVLSQQFARNPKIVRLINKFPNPPNKDIGEGLNTAFEAMKKLKLKEPEITEGENSVIVHIRHSPLASPQDAVMHYLETHNEITNKIAREITGIGSENVMKDVFKSLAKRQLLEMIPEKRGNASAWRKFTGSLTAPSSGIQKSKRGLPKLLS